jgi:hypothetical protein
MLSDRGVTKSLATGNQSVDRIVWFGWYPGVAGWVEGGGRPSAARALTSASSRPDARRLGATVSEHFRCANSPKRRTCRSGRSSFISRRRMILPEKSLALGPAGDARGLGRTWKLSECWVRLSGEIGIALEPLRIDEPGLEHAGARCVLLGSLKAWVEDTRRSLRQAQLRHELKPAANIRTIAIEIHQLLWSRSWTSALYGPEASAHSILGAIWRHLSAVAADPSVTLPSLEEVFTEPAPEPEEEPPEDISSDPFPPTWKLVLQATDPLYQAFERHEIMGDPRNFAYPPEVTPDDIARAEAYTKSVASRSTR